MRKRLIALLGTVIMLSTVLSICAFATGKPSVEMMYLDATWSDTGVSDPAFGVRVNSKKTVKYIDWYVSAYNRVGDKVQDDVFSATRRMTEVGPMTPFHLERSSSFSLKVMDNAAENSPFRIYKETGYGIAIDDVFRWVYQDAYDNFFILTDVNDPNSGVYLSEDEIANAMFDYIVDYPDTKWTSRIVDFIQVDYIVVTYMDGSTETITDMGSKYRTMSLQNRPFAEQLAQYQAVYNYEDYLKYNPDLAERFGTNQKALFEHFVTSGIKEGRQGSAEFNLNTYKANNPDLVAAFGDDNVKYYEHYISGGKAEGRIAA